jgi:NAD(P)-dependent dehydrogenase (short-subunit alcohol dehydrogenase family)
MKSKSKNIVITGTSTGIGYGLAKELINRGYTIFGSVRKQEDAARIQLELGEKFIPLLFDVTDDAAIIKAAEAVKTKLNGEGLGGLINNSGISITGPMEHLDIEKVRSNFDINVLGIFRVTKAFLPLLGTQPNHPSPPGRILNISSVAGKLAAPFLSPYVGSKHAVEGISHCLRLELLPYGIDVIIIGPGAVQTPIWDKGNVEEFKTTRYIAALVKYLGKFASTGKKGMPLNECSLRIADILESPKPKTRYTLVQGKFKKWTLPLLMPDRVIDSFFRKNLYNKI